MKKLWVFGIVILGAAVLLATGLRGSADDGSADARPPVRVEPPEEPKDKTAGENEGRRKRKPKQKKTDSRRQGGRRSALRNFMRLSDEDVQEFLQKHLPPVRKWLENLKESKPDRYEREMQRMRFLVMRLRRIERQSEQLFKAEVKAMELRLRTLRLADRVRKATDEAERKKLRKQLKGLLGDQFDIKMRTMQAHIERLEREIKKLKKMMSRRSELKQKAVQKRLEQLLASEEEKKLLRWDF